jgi:uncharacterized protein involved in exopolysaccharide biosynthesis
MGAGGPGERGVRERRWRGLDAAEIVHVLFKRKRLIGAVVLAVVAAAVVPHLLARPVWEASTVLLMSRHPADGELPERDFLARPAVLGQVVERLGPAVVMQARLDGAAPPAATPARVAPTAPVLPGAPGSGDRPRVRSPEEDRAVRALAARLDVTPLPRAGAVKVAVRGQDATFAAAVLGQVVTDYLAEDRAPDGPEAPAAFLDAERRRVEAELSDAEASLRRLDGERGAGTAVQQREAYLRTAHERETALQATRSEVQELGEKRRVLSAQLERLPEKVVRAHEVRANPVLASMRGKLLELELERNTLLQRYQAHNRRVRDVENDIALLRQRFLAESDWEFARETYGHNPVRDPLLVELFNTEAQLIRSEVKARHLERAVRDFTVRLQHADRLAYERARAERRVALLGEAHARYARAWDEARIAAVRDTQRRMEVARVEPIHVGPVPRPALTELSVGGGLAGLAGGMVLALVLEALGTTFTTPAGVRRRLGLPVLGVLPAKRPE